MKVLMINVVCGNKSTGRICTDAAKSLSKEGHTVKIAYGRGEVPEDCKKYAVKISNNFDIGLNVLLCRAFDNAGFGTKLYTKKFLKWVEEFNPDEIHLHNIHGYYINVELLFNYLRTCGKRIIWTLHDCWAFTGHCYHFSYIGCNRWKTGCYNCPQKKLYPSTYGFDQSRHNYKRKSELFSSIPNLNINVPSKWLKCLVIQSYLKDYDVTVVPNTVDEAVFKPMSDKVRRATREEIGVGNRKMILGVASRWYRKGLHDFYRLSELISDDYVIVLVGLDEKQIRSLPKNIIGFLPIYDVYRLVMLYSAADVCISLSKEETFGLTILEAIKCGTPAIAYKDTACQEIVEEYGGVAVEQDVQEIWNAIRKVCESITIIQLF